MNNLAFYGWFVSWDNIPDDNIDMLSVSNSIIVWREYIHIRDKPYVLAFRSRPRLRCVLPNAAVGIATHGE